MADPNTADRTGPPGEMLDVYDEMGVHLGVADRRTVHSEGLWHRVFHLLIVADRDGIPTVVLQRRSVTKLAFPGRLDLSATGHLAAGEEPIDGLRELQEELGIQVRPEALTPLGVRRIVDMSGEGHNREFCHVFLVHDDRPLVDYRPDPAEVDAVVELPVETALDLFSRRRARATATCFDGKGSAVSDLVVVPESFVPEAPMANSAPQVAVSGYWLTLLVMAARSAAGDQRLAI